MALTNEFCISIKCKIRNVNTDCYVKNIVLHERMITVSHLCSIKSEYKLTLVCIFNCLDGKKSGRCKNINIFSNVTNRKIMFFSSKLKMKYSSMLTRSVNSLMPSRFNLLYRFMCWRKSRRNVQTFQQSMVNNNISTFVLILQIVMVFCLQTSSSWLNDVFYGKHLLVTLWSLSMDTNQLCVGISGDEWNTA